MFLAPLAIARRVIDVIVVISPGCSPRLSCPGDKPRAVETRAVETRAIESGEKRKKQVWEPSAISPSDPRYAPGSPPWVVRGVSEGATAPERPRLKARGCPRWWVGGVPGCKRRGDSPGAAKPRIKRRGVQGEILENKVTNRVL